MIVASLSVVPIDKGASVSEYVKIAIKALDEAGVSHESNAMSTVIETDDIDSLLRAVKMAHEAVSDAGCVRVVTQLKIDDRRDKDHTINRKLTSIGLGR